MTTNSNANPWETGNEELERLALEELVKRWRFDRAVSVLILPAKRLNIAFDLARMGASVTLADHPAQQRDIEGRILAAGLRDQIRFTPCELPALPDALSGQPFDIILCRRALCSLPYEAARLVARQLLHKLKIGGKLYLSILGLHSELADGYDGLELPIEQRYAKLDPAMIEKYGIPGPVCLYSERNLFMLLLDAGGSVLRTLTSTYGNVKGVAVRI